MRAVKQQLRDSPLQGAQAFFSFKKNGRMTMQVKGLKDKNVALAYQKVKKNRENSD